MEILYKNYIIYLDDEDFHYFTSRNWSISKNNRKETTRYLLHKGLSFHRSIMGLGIGDKDHIDHINNNGLDNRKSNLRICNRNNNMANQQVDSDRTWRGKKKTSRYKGVWFDKSRDKYRANIGYQGTTHKLGTFNTEEDAAQAYNEAAIKLHGEFAQLNKLEITI